ncbi:molecular chaperone [Buttiauxella selenatireducens]|uniref:Molecular chaperone n=1 Tax=Buttiauxella selenatireducens TaxID=3073902 RepID=A0ABY9S6S2_9ENTR|nr:molecular chaperone [Buttiauxella sp. R73]WMY73219.1 molecular chaperone [Buttiauxella sp. R73]
MKIVSGALFLSLLLATASTYAGVVVGGTRVIYDGGKKESSLSVNNPDNVSYLIQSWIDTGENGTEKAPFMVTPPLFRLDGSKSNVLRIVRAGGNLATDRESLYWMNIKAIPSVEQDNSKNTLQIAVKTRIKLIYRPQGLKGVPEESAEKLVWKRNGNSLSVTNPTPFYMNFQEVKVGGKEVADVTYVAPQSSATFKLLSGVTAGTVTWKIISDFGGIGEEHRAAL